MQVLIRRSKTSFLSACVRLLAPLFLVMVMVLLFFTASMYAQVKSQQPLLLGSAWYPEQWPETRWEADLQLMQEANMHVVRVGEFAWSSLEPTEGKYNLDWLERAINLAGKHGIYTVLGTPSAAPPAWLTQKYPQTLLTLEDGKKEEHGNRQQFNFANSKYRELCREIVKQMAKRFGHNPYVLGWQIGNELSRASFDIETKKQFQQWVKTRYGTLDNLNARWTTSYWSQTYNDWSQLPIETVRGNPGLLLSWQRFISDTWVSFVKNQTNEIKAYSDPKQFITTNMMGWFPLYDSYALMNELNMGSVDNYVGQGAVDTLDSGSIYDLTRGLLHKNFWVMETQPGFVNWAHVNTALDKGAVRALVWFQIGHGADAVLFWQWRSALNGQEQYHGTLLGQDGKPMLVYSEIAQVGRELAKIAPEIEDTSPHSDVAILHSYDSRWAIDRQRFSQSFDTVAQIKSFYRPLLKAAQSVDIISADAPLDQYKLVVAPGLNVLSDAEAEHLAAYVRNGGHLVLGQRSGYKTTDNALQPVRQPGPLANLLGAQVQQYFAIDRPAPVTGAWGSNTTKIWAEMLDVKAPEVEVLERHGISNGWLDGQPAVVTRRVGKGRITYIGVWLDDAGMDRAADWMLHSSNIIPAFGPVPAGVEVLPRYGAKSTIFIMVNFYKSESKMTLPHTMTDLMQGGSINTVTLPAYGVAVMQSINR